MAVIQRVIRYLRLKNISQKELANESITQASINKIFLGKTKNPGIKFFEAVAEACPELNWNWVFTGEGSEEIGEDVSGVTPELRKKIEKYMSERMELLEQLVADKNSLIELQGKLTEKEELLRQKDEVINSLRRENEGLRNK